MTAALYMLCALTSSLPAEGAAARLGGGVFGLLPAATLRAEAPLGGFALGVRYDTAAGLVHDVGLSARYAVDAWHVELDVSHGFVGLEEIAGIQLDDIPLGQGLTTALVGLGEVITSSGHRVRLGGGLTAKWTAIETVLEVQERVFEPSLHHVHGEVRVDWTNGLFLRGRAVVPVAAELRVIGFWPQLLVGRTWAL